MPKQILGKVVGEKGDAGFSPIVDLSKKDGILTISIEDEKGIHTETIETGEYVKPNWNSPSDSPSGILNKPDLSTVATTGQYEDLIGTPTKATANKDGLMSKEAFEKLDGIAAGAQVNTITGVKGAAEATYRTGEVNITPGNIGALATTDIADWAKAQNKPSYTANEVGALADTTTLADLTGDTTHRLVTDVEKANWNAKLDSFTEEDPTVPSHVKSIKATDISAWNAKAEISDVPTVTDIYSATSSDAMSGKAVASGIANAISGITGFDYEVVTSLPSAGVKGKIYLVASTVTEEKNIYDEYIWVSTGWEMIGTTKIDLSGYQTKLSETQINAVNSGITSAKVTTYDGYASTIGNKVDKVSGKGLSTNDFTNTYKTAIDNLPSSYAPTNAQANVIESIKVNGTAQTITSKAVNITVPTTASDIGAMDSSVTHLSGDVPTTRKVNGKALSSDITLSASDVGALPDDTTIPTVVDTYSSTSTNAMSGKAVASAISGKANSSDIPTESTVSGWGFTKNNGTYSKPSGGIPKTDLASAVQTSLDKADTALQSVSKSDVGLGNVGNFKAVSTVASQGLTDTEKSNARTNIGLGGAATKSVDTSIAAASSSANLPTSAAVASFVEGKGYKTTDNNTTYTFAEGSTNGAFSVTPSGGSATSVKIHGLGSLAYSSATIPTVTDTYSSTSTSAMSGKAVASAISGKANSATTLAGYGITDAKIASGVITLGGNTITPLTSHQSNLNLGTGYATCSTAEATTAKVVSLSNYVLATGGILSVKFTNAVPANATLNVNSKGAKNIFFNGAAITAGIIKAGYIATFMFDGTQYQLIAIDHATGSSPSPTGKIDLVLNNSEPTNYKVGMVWIDASNTNIEVYEFKYQSAEPTGVSVGCGWVG